MGDLEHVHTLTSSPDKSNYAPICYKFSKEKSDRKRKTTNDFLLSSDRISLNSHSHSNIDEMDDDYFYISNLSKPVVKSTNNPIPPYFVTSSSGTPLAQIKHIP